MYFRTTISTWQLFWVFVVIVLRTCLESRQENKGWFMSSRFQSLNLIFTIFWTFRNDVVHYTSHQRLDVQRDSVCVTWSNRPFTTIIVLHETLNHSDSTLLFINLQIALDISSKYSLMRNVVHGWFLPLPYTTLPYPTLQFFPRFNHPMLYYDSVLTIL